MGTSGLPNIRIYLKPKGCRSEGCGCIYEANHECTWYNYYITLSSYANGFTVFIVVPIAFDCGFKLGCFSHFTVFIVVLIAFDFGFKL